MFFHNTELQCCSYCPLIAKWSHYYYYCHYYYYYYFRSHHDASLKHWNKPQVRLKEVWLHQTSLDSGVPHIYQEIKVTDMKYKNRVRSRISNLKDPKNPGLRKNVLAGTIELSRIAAMSSEVQWKKPHGLPNSHSVSLSLSPSHSLFCLTISLTLTLLSLTFSH